MTKLAPGISDKSICKGAAMAKLRKSDVQWLPQPSEVVVQAPWWR